MPSNLDRYKKDLSELIETGEGLFLALEAILDPGRIKQKYGDKAAQYLKSLPDFRSEYQTWYSEAKVVVKQLLPERLSDFVGYYESPKQRRELSCENYRIADSLQGLTASRTQFGQTIEVVGPKTALPQFYQQLSILKSVEARFESSLFDIRQLLQADLFDSEIEVAKELAKNKFLRAAGAVAGVVLERHLRQVCDNHNISITKKSPTISDFNDALKANGVIETPVWRFIQHLGDLRNLCDHDKQKEPTPIDIDDLITGVAKITKTVF